MRVERLFIEYLGMSLNQMRAHPKARGVYIGERKKIGDALMYAGVKQIAQFTHPIDIWYFPQVVVGKSGRISKQFDCINFGITYKCIEDWLVKFGVLVNDDRDWVYAVHCGRSELADDGIPGIRIGLIELDVAVQWQDSLELVVTPEIPF